MVWSKISSGRKVKMFSEELSKLCDPEFSNWDWVAVRRARELDHGASDPDDLQLVFDKKDSPFAVYFEKRDWITEEALSAPKASTYGPSLGNPGDS